MSYQKILLLKLMMVIFLMLSAPSSFAMEDDSHTEILAPHKAFVKQKEINSPRRTDYKRKNYKYKKINFENNKFDLFPSEKKDNFRIIAGKDYIEFLFLDININMDLP